MTRELIYVIVSTQLQTYFKQFGYLGIYIWFITVDQIIPIPEEITLIIVGYLASHGYINPFLAGGFSIAAFITVDVVYFLLTKSGNKLIQKITGKTKSPKVNKYRERLKNHTFKTLLILCFIPRMRLLGPVYVALLKIPLPKFLLYDALSLCAFTTVYISLGFVFHESLSTLVTKTNSVTDIIFGSAMVLMAVFTVVIIRKLR
ncbi:MAG TPA: VTT domain-containing protein [Bacteroidia bacterium]|jgi:membrane protein DedA with SNARE-associated domain|nr:VTT domain-containing protein [Bacteroidia bacterium]